MASIVLVEDVIRRQHFRFYELINLVNKKDGRRELTFEDQGFVGDIDTFITGCLSGYPVTFNIDSATINWKLLKDVKQFKTMLSFYNDEITCQGLFFKDLKGYEKERFKNITTFCICINPCTIKEKEDAVKILTI